MASTMDRQQIAERFARLPREKQQAFLVLLQKQGVDFARLPIVPLAPGQRAELSYAQLRQWFLWQLDPQSTAYHIAGALRLHGALDVEALRASFSEIVARHASLRTVFRADADGQCEQVVQPHAAVDVALVDLCGAGGDAEALAREEARRLSATPFDLTTGPLMRVGLIRLAPQMHVLVLVMHHIVSDGGSLQLLVGEFVARYRAKLQGVALDLPPPSIGYADFAAWQRNWLEAGEKQRQLAWWTAQLGGAGSAQPVLQLATDRARRAGARHTASRHEAALPAALAQALRVRAQRGGTTVFVVLLAALQALLHRYSGQTDIRVGVSVANRHRAETEGVVGLFVNTQVLRNRLDGHTPLATVLAQAKEAATGAQAHQDLPFEQLVDALQPERSQSVTPLFQVMFSHERHDARTLAQLPGLWMADYALAAPAAQFELVLHTREAADGRLHAGFIYAAELFEPGTMARMTAHYVAMLEAMVRDEALAVADVPLLTPAEHAELDAWGVNARREPGASATPVHHRIAQQASRQPDATALLFGDEALRYAELERRANRLAHHLIARGVRPEQRVGIAMQRSSELIVAILGVLKAGAAYVPLDPDYPAERLAYIAEDSAIALLLTHGPTRGCIPEGGFTVLEVDSLDLASEPATDPQVPVHGEHLAYVIYTSGSTGRPKGAAIRHAALASCMAWMQHTYGIGGEDTVLHKAPFGFDVSCWEIFWPLTAGARLVVANPGDQRDPARLIALIRRHQVTTLNFVPAMLQAFLAHEGIEADTRLRHIICGGEAMPAETQRETLRRLQGATLQNLYGPTETTIHVTQWTCRDDGEPLVPIGRPISHTSAHVLDAELQRVPRGVAGELYLGGVSLARGYLNRPGLTAERFVADPLDAEGKGGRLYRTGDLVRWNAEGQIEYLGRIDHQVKIRGLRIELGEIEAQLLAQPGVREAVVVAREAAPTGARLIAYLSAHAGAPLDAQALKQSLAQSLPDYMVPRAVVVLDALPLNANGKVDRSALPAVEATNPSATKAAPEGAAEEALAAIWREVLGVAHVGRDDNFFELGGDSLLSLKLLAQARRRVPGGGHLGLADVMQAASLRELAARAMRASEGTSAGTHDAVCLHAGGAGVPLFCLPGLIVNTREFQPLARAVQGDRPVYAFVSHVYTQRRWRGFAIQALAAEYADFIVATATGGRCALLGWSLGGDLAFEVARQLRGRIEIVFFGAVDVFEPEPMVPTGNLTPAERAQADAVLADWLACSGMAGRWRELMARMNDAERCWVAEQLIAPTWVSPLDGAGDEAYEYLLWATLDSRVQSARYAEARTELPVRVFHAEASLRAPGVLRRWPERARVLSTEVVARTAHLDIVGDARFGETVRRQLLAADLT